MFEFVSVSQQREYSKAEGSMGLPGFRFHPLLNRCAFSSEWSTEINSLLSMPAFLA